MPIPKKLTERLDDANRALEAIYEDAGAIDNRADEAELRANEAEERAEEDREARQAAVSKLSGAEQAAIDARGDAAGEIAQLQASERLRVTKRPT
jgi:hypothetical protein